MSSVAVGLAVFCAAFLAWASARFLVRFANCRTRLLDLASRDLRKIHSSPTPRVGGIAVALGLVGGLVAASQRHGELGKAALLLICVSPGLVWGLIEDVTSRGKVFVRLALNGAAAAAGFMLLDARITQLDLFLIDNLLQIHAVSFIFTLFAVAGVANAMNVIDGLNGLSGVTALVASIGLAVVGWTVGDTFVFYTACVLAASLAGFLAVNFPSGRIFLGDGGAYFIGLLLAELSVMLVHRNVQVSPWFPLVLLAYPVWETLYSMYRRKMRGRSIGGADALHLHTLVYRRIVRWKGPEASAAETVARNSLASLFLWNIPIICCGIALIFWNQSLVLQCVAVAFALPYVAVYRRIVRFRVPAWLIMRDRPTQTLEAETVSAIRADQQAVGP